MLLNVSSFSRGRLDRTLALFPDTSVYRGTKSVTIDFTEITRLTPILVLLSGFRKLARPRLKLTGSTIAVNGRR